MAEKELLRSKHAFGTEANIDSALESGLIDEFDVLFLTDADGNPKIGWIDKNGKKVIVNDKEQIIRVSELPTKDGDENVVYLFKNKGYVWDNEQEKCIPMSESTDVTELTEKIQTLETALSKKADTETVNTQIKATLGEHLSKIGAYKISDAPDGTLVNYLDKEVRVMIPSDHQWVLRPSGEGADQTKYYIGFKAYAPEGAMSFKEDMKQTIEDETVFYFEDNDFAGIEEDGRKFSIIWLPVAFYDNDSETWTYHGAESTEGNYAGWYYSVEWYNEAGEIISSDCIRINLANEVCYSVPKPYYVSDAAKDAKTYTDEQIASILDAFTVVEF